MNFMALVGDVRRRQALRSTALRLLLCAFCLCGSARATLGQGAGAETFAPQEKDVRRAEKVLDKLRPLVEAAALDDDAELRRLARKLYPGLFATVAEMRPSDLKTDLDTVVYLYEALSRARADEVEQAADCERERPDVYRPLCRGLAGGPRRRLLAAKARLHARWAEAVVKSHRGAGDAEAARLVSEMRAARANDLRIAARVARELKSLEGAVEPATSYADYLERGDAAKVSFERLDAEFADALSRAGALLGWLPRSPVRYQLSAAWRSYRDGLFWYQKVKAAGRKVVSAAAAGFEHDPLRELRLDASQVGYTAAANWRAAAKYTRLAESSLPPAAVARDGLTGRGGVAEIGSPATIHASVRLSPFREHSPGKK